MAKKLRIRQVRSAIGRAFDQKGTLKALGIRKLNKTVIKDDIPQIRGMIRKIRHLLLVEEIEEKEVKSQVKKSRPQNIRKEKKLEDDRKEKIDLGMKKKDNGKNNET